MKKILLIFYFIVSSFVNIFSTDSKLNFDLQKLTGKKNLIYTAILGSGPAGLSAGLYTARNGFHSIIFQGFKPGGQLIDGILVENWPGVDKAPGMKVIEKLENQVKSFGAKLVSDTIKEVDFKNWPFKLVGQSKTYYAMSVIVATGATPKKLNIKGEKKFWSKGILSCGLCDAHLAKSQHVVVVGGGDSAVERVLQLAPHAKSIDVLVRENKMTASKNMLRKIKDLENIKIIYNTEAKEFFGKNQLEGIITLNNKTKEKNKIKTNWVFLSIGFKPNSKLFKNQLKIDKQGYIIADPKTQRTSVKGVFVAGNVSDNEYRQASTASGDAVKAALNATEFIQNLGINKILKQQLKKNLFVPKKSCAIKELKSEQEFNKTIDNRSCPVLVYFYSDLCFKCKLTNSIISSINDELKNKIKVIKVDRSKFENIVEKYNIQTVPQVLIFKNGQILNKIEKINKNKLLIKLNKLVK